MLTAAVVAHLVLHRRRVGEMIARLVRPVGSARGPGGAAASRSQDPAERVAPTPADQPRPRFTRRWFLVLAAGAVAAVDRRPAPRSRRLAPRRSRDRRACSRTSRFSTSRTGRRRWPPQAGWSGRWPRGQPAAPRSQPPGLPCRTRRRRATSTASRAGASSNLGWKGVRVADLLSLAKPQAGGQFVTFHAYGGTYPDSLTLAEAQAPETLLADSLDGETAAGGPRGPAASGHPLSARLQEREVGRASRGDREAGRRLLGEPGLSGRGAGALNSAAAECATFIVKRTQLMPARLRAPHSGASQWDATRRRFRQKAAIPSCP